MLFNSLEYFVFLGLCLLGYHALGQRRQNVLLLLASYLFYSFWDWRFLSLILISTAVDFLAGREIERARGRGDPRAMLRAVQLSLATNLGILGAFKYFGFFVESAVQALGGLGISLPQPALYIILPVGISFYTFQTLSYTLDIYRGRLKPVDDPIDFALFVAFFPQLVAGPIERARSLLPQIQSPRSVTPRQFEEGVWLILLGLFRKVVIADTAASWVDRAFEQPGEQTSLQLLTALLLYALQIYGDFSGYSNIARGSAKLLGFEVMRNFRHPYFATSPRDFWRRWHISLSSWLRDYLYISLGGNRGGNLRTQRNLMLTMLIGGLWHGASWNFVVWGGLHGLYLVGHRVLEPWLERVSPAPGTPAGRAARLAGGVLTLALVCFTWLFFRSTDMETTSAYLVGLAALSGFGALHVLWPLVVLTGLTLLVDLPQALRDDEFACMRWPVLQRVAVASGLVAATLFGGSAAAPFIYFQF